MIIERSIHIDADPSKVWNIVARDFAEVGTWTTAVDSSRPREVDSGTGAPVEGRYCETSFGPLTERVTAYDPEARSISYLAERGMPGFVTHAGNTWTVEAAEGGARVHMRLRMEVAWWAAPMGLMMRLQMGSMATQILEELRHFATTGRVHPKKARKLVATAA